MNDKMSSRDFLGVDGEPNLRLPVTRRLLQGGSGSLFGGVGLAAGIAALEQHSGRPVVWATGQYVSTTGPPATLELDTELTMVGRSVTQGRVVGRDDGREVIAILGACGSRREDHAGVWHSMPTAPPPELCALVEREGGEESLHSHVEVRMARGMFGFHGVGEPTGDGSTLVWAHMRDVEHDPGALAIIADYLPSAIGNAVGEIVHATSLDNTIRFANAGAPIDGWILCENRIEFVGAGFAHGTSLLWSQAGDLVAVASQTATVSAPRE